MRVLLLSLSLLAACQEAPVQQVVVPGTHAKVGDTVLTANGLEITDKMMEAVTRNTPPTEVAKRKQMGTWVKMVEQVGLGEVFYNQAIDAKLHEDPKIKLSLAMGAREVLAQEYFQSEINKRVTESAVAKHYKDRAVAYTKNQVKASHILLREQAKAQEVMDKLAKGAAFADLAKEYSEDGATKEKGGDLGWFERTKLIPEIATVAFEGELGKPVGPIETRFGFHVLLPVERRDMVPLEEARDEIENELKNKAAEEIITQVKADLKYEYFGEVKELKEQIQLNGMPGAVPPPPLAKEGPHSHGPGGAPHAPHGPGGAGAAPHGAGGPH